MPYLTLGRPERLTRNITAAPASTMAASTNQPLMPAVTNRDAARVYPARDWTSLVHTLKISKDPHRLDRGGTGARSSLYSEPSTVVTVRSSSARALLGGVMATAVSGPSVGVLVAPDARGAVGTRRHVSVTMV